MCIPAWSIHYFFFRLIIYFPFSFNLLFFFVTSSFSIFYLSLIFFDLLPRISSLYFLHFQILPSVFFFFPSLIYFPSSFPSLCPLIFCSFSLIFSLIPSSCIFRLSPPLYTTIFFLPSSHSSFSPYTPNHSPFFVFTTQTSFVSTHTHKFMLTIVMAEQNSPHKTL